MQRSWDNYDARTSRARPMPEKTDHFLNELPQEASVLDFGAGIGRWAELMARARPDLKIDVLDVRANELSAHYDGIPQVRERMHSSFEEFRAEGREYDGIWARSSLFFLPGEQLPPVLDELCKSLKKDGMLEFSFIEPAPDMPHNFYPMTKLEMQKMLEAAGFTVEAMLDEQSSKYGEQGIPLPTYIVRARKK